MITLSWNIRSAKYTKIMTSSLFTYTCKILFFFGCLCHCKHVWWCHSMCFKNILVVDFRYVEKILSYAYCRLLDLTYQYSGTCKRLRSVGVLWRLEFLAFSSHVFIHAVPNRTRPEWSMTLNASCWILRKIFVYYDFLLLFE